MTSEKQSRPSTLEQVSAGGVVIRRTAQITEVAIVLVAPEMRWQLPKGLVDKGETLEQAAVREVREEAGIDAEIIGPIDTIEYWFQSNWDSQPKRIHKIVHFFLMMFLAGDVGDHDDEVAESRWVSIDTALKMLEFESERSIVEKAHTMAAQRT